MSLRFDKKNVVITGGSSGVGLALAERFASKGAELHLIARNMDKLIKAQRLLEQKGSGLPVHVYSCDVSDYESVKSVFGRITDMSGNPDILINSAGILCEGYFEHKSVSTFYRVMDANFYGTLHTIKAALPLFQKKGNGRIVNMCSVAGQMGVFGYTAYCSSKHAIVGLTEALRVELQPQKADIRLHLVCPPEFESPMVDEINKVRSKENRCQTNAIPVLPVEMVADAVINGIKKNRFEIVPGRMARMAVTLFRLFPGASRRYADALIKKIYRGPAESVQPSEL